MTNPCDSCAFRQGCATHDKEAHNRLRSLICAAAGIPFLCHHGFDWKTAELFLINRRLVPFGGEITERLHVCEGWKREVARRAKRGWFRVRPEVRKTQIQLGNVALKLVNDFIDAPEESEEKKQHLADLGAVLEMLFQKPERTAA